MVQQQFSLKLAIEYYVINKGTLYCAYKSMCHPSGKRKPIDMEVFDSSKDEDAAAKAEAWCIQKRKEDVSK